MHIVPPSYLRRLARIVAATALFGPAVCVQAADCLANPTPVSSLELKVLLITADGTEAVLPAMKATLAYLGIPYDTFVAKDQLLTANVLCTSPPDGSGAGRYQAVMLATGSLGFLNTATGNFESALSLEEWTRLWQYEAKYKVRQATMYTYPGSWPDTFGLTAPSAAFDTTTTPLSLTLTSTVPTGSDNPTGRQVFSYLRPSNPVVIRNAYTYLAMPAAGAAVTPLLVDAAGHAIVSINNYADGRKNLTITADGNPNLIHTLSLGYGIVNWVTKGLYVGQRRVSMTVQPDDVMIPDDIWDAARSSDATGKSYRITANDYRKVIAWQTNRNANNPGNVVLEMPFNGEGSAGDLTLAELYPATRDDLTPAIKADDAPFNWISHTYSHMALDAPVNYSQVLAELRQNHKVAVKSVRLGNYVKDGLVTPEISGLNNPEALRAMSDFGIRYVVSDTSKYCGNRDATPRPCPAPNTGIYNDLQPNILMIPRYPTNLFYNVCTPAEWVSEYNFIYYSFWGRSLSFPEILDKESEIWLRYLMNHDLRPLMFHQSNLCAYDGKRSLLGDLIDTTLAKYNAIFNLPVQSRRQRQVGNLMAERMAFNDAVNALAPLTARLVPGATGSSIVIANPAAKPVVVPITGVNWTGAVSRETYGGQITSKVAVGAGVTSVTVTGAPAW